ncbi:hypothetical protein F0562_025016 [Nyssa sinensis]|uniref:Peptidase S54 rhomboid domain-containing protein n=1 Tax=Nyssa sinensis TaxID=561372 RepID=A0A5J5BDB2_9ASTE|nr:hypothetical protein F0562_025016 [Nyssa sinensis]
MQKLLSLKLLSKSARNLSYNSSCFQSICSKNLFSLSKTNQEHLHFYPFLNQPHHLFSHFTISSHSWRSKNGFPEKIYGFLSNPVLVKQLLPNALLKSTSKGLIDSRGGFLRAQLRRRIFDFNPSFESHRRTWQSWFRRLTPDGVVLGLILTNVAVFMLWQVADRKFMMNNFTISIDNFRSGHVHTLITSAFSHIEAGHLISNMIGLYFFGMSIGRVFGREYLLKLYLSGAVVGSIFYLVHHAFMTSSSETQRMWGMDPSRTPGLGASGAVNAIMLLNIFLFPKSTLYLEFIIPVPAILLGIFLIGKDMLRILEGDSQISGSAHLGGAVVAAIAWARIKRGRF